MAIKMTLEDGTVVEGTAEELSELQRLAAEGSTGKEPKEVSDKKIYDKPVRVGDTIRITDAFPINAGRDYVNGDIMTVLHVGSDGDVTKTDKYGRLIVEREFEIIGRDVPQTELSTDKRKAKKGDTIIVGKTYVTTEDGFFGDIPKGTEVFSDGDVNSRGHRVFLLDESDFDRIKPEHLTEVEETEEDDDPKVGDIVRVTGSDYGHPVGTIGEVVPAPEFLGTDVGVLANGQKKSHIGQMEIICRKEDRIDV